MTNESVVNEWASSMWTARVVRQVKSTPYRLTMLLALFTKKGPNRSTAENENGGWSGVTRSTGKFAIF